MQTPHGFIFGRFPGMHCRIEKAHRHNFLAEDVIDELLAALFRNSPLFPPVNIFLEFLIPLNVAPDACSKLRVEIEVGGVFGFRAIKSP